jgi:hypothetical protein
LIVWSLLAPAAADAESVPQPVRVGLYVTSISDIDFANGSFAISAYAWFVHHSAEYEPTSQIAVGARESSVETIRRSSLPDGGFYDWVRLKATVDQDFTYDRFPFDQQSLRLVIEAEDPVTLVQLMPDEVDTRIAETVALTGWDVLGWRLTGGSASYDTDFGYPGEEVRTYSRLVLTIDVARQRSGLILEKFLGFTMAFLLSLLIYLIPADQFGVRVGLAGGAIFAAVGNRYSLDALLGSDSQVGLVDQLTLLVFASIYTALVVSLITYRLRERQDPEAADRVDRLVGICASTLFLVLAAAFFLHARA